MSKSCANKHTKPCAVLRRALRNEERKWSQSVKNRDNHICQRCGHKGDHAHHIFKFKISKSLFLELDNGITLCWPCHDIVEYGQIKPYTIQLMNKEK